MRAFRRFLFAVTAVAATSGSAEAAFAFRKPLTIDGTRVLGVASHLNFPVLVSVVDPDLRTVASGGGVRSTQGYDIAFRAADGTTVLDWQLERYDGTNGTLVAWVRFPGTVGPPDTRIQNGVNTQFFIYYGDPTLGCCQVGHGTVWDANYRFVYHLDQATGNPVDSTRNGVGTLINPGADAAAVENRNVAGIIGGALEMLNPPTAPPATFGPTTDSHLKAADGSLAASTPFTLEAWFTYNAANTGVYVGLVSKQRDGCLFPCDGPGEDWIGLAKTNANRLSLAMDIDGSGGNVDGLTALVANRWYYGAVTFNGTNTRRVILYDNVDQTDAVTASPYVAIGNATRVGDDSNGNYLNGRIDEVRFSTVERTPEWLRTTARNQACPSATTPAPACGLGGSGIPIVTPFLAAGAQQAVAAATTSDCCQVGISTTATKVTLQTSDTQMVWDTLRGAGLSEFYVEEEASGTVSRRGDAAYNLFSTQVNDGAWHFESDAAGTLQVLETTPVRARLRQLYDYTPTLHLDRTWSVYSFPRLALDETFVVDSTQDIRGAQGIHAKGQASCADTTAGNTFYCAGQALGPDRIWLVTDNQNTYGDMLAVVNNTNALFNRAGAGGNFQTMDEGGAPGTFFSRVHEPGPLTSMLVGGYRFIYFLYPRLAGLGSTGTAWLTYANDLRFPDPLLITTGSAWNDADELATTDNYNEAEAAYVLQASASGAVTFDLDGSAFAHRKPFFKIRGWHSLGPPSLVTLEGSNFTNGQGITAAVKPVTRAYSCPTAACATSTQRAEGGLTTDTDEFLADATRNFTLDFSGTNYLYIGSDSKFRGLNVALAAPGTGTVDLQWQYWNSGSGWQNLEAVGGFTDETANFTKKGTVYWTSDPASWGRTNVVTGGIPLFYVRVSRASGGYTTSPVEAAIRTDILLLQYCGDVFLDFQTFSIPAPVPTAVTLQSFTAAGAAGAVDLAWTTASELQNLGFHLYRSTAPGGPYERITSALLPGLGSSPTGKTYSYRDPGRIDGQTYYYELEDVDASGRTERHGPVAATTAPAGDDGGDESGPPARVTYGDPESTAFRVKERGESYVILELTTPGFYATLAGDGGVRLEVPGFEGRPEAGAPSVPVKRVFVEAVAGRRVRLTSALPTDEVRFEGLAVAPAEAPALLVSEDGGVRAGWAGRRRRRLEGPFPSSWAELLGVAFQGETKKARVQMSPLRYDPTTGTVVLARRLLVRLDFVGREAGETGSGGSEGRRPRAFPSGGTSGVLAELVTSEAGLHAVRFEDVLAGESAVAAASLRLSRQGRAVPYRLEPEGAKLFGPGARLFFVNDASGPDERGESVYVLERGRPVAMAVKAAPPSGPALPTYVDEKAWEENHYYQAGLLDAPDLWLWDLVVSPGTKDFSFDLDPLGGSPTAARLRVWLQGASDFEADPDHHVRVRINGVLVDEASWDGKTERALEAEIPAGLLRPGANTLSLESVGDTGAAYSMVFLNRFSVRYPRAWRAENGVLEGRAEQSGAAEVAGIGTHGFVVETDDPAWLTGLVPTSTGVSFRADAGRTYLVVSADAVRAPTVRRPVASSLRSPSNRADWLLIAPREFLEVAEPLVELRRRQGLWAKTVALEEIYQEFGQGEARASALRDFLAFAYQTWRQPSCRYVVLLGDATYDPRDYLGTGTRNRVPPYLVKTSYLWTASDPAYASVNGDDLLPDVAIGRLPAGSVVEAARLVEKILRYENGGGTLDGSAVLVADDADAGGSFEASADAIASGPLRGREVLKLYLRELGAGSRGAILAAFDDGPGLLSYLGHGATAVWASENVLNTTDVPTLASQDRQPFVLTLNCLNGFFHFPPFDSLGEAFLKAEGKGAIAVFAPSGLSLNESAHVYHEALLTEIEAGGHGRLGDALLAAQAAYAASGQAPELLSVYHLLGDPALRIR